MRNLLMKVPKKIPNKFIKKKIEAIDSYATPNIKLIEKYTEEFKDFGKFSNNK